MKPVCRHMRVEGAGIDKQLSLLMKNGFTLYDVRKINLKSTEFSCERTVFSQISDHLTQRGFSVTPLPPRGAARQIQSLRAHTFLIILSLCALLFLSFAMRFLWRIDVRGARSYVGEVRLFIREENIRPGILLDSLDLKALTEKLTLRLPLVAWVRMQLRGPVLQIEVTQGVPMPDIETEGGNGSIVAAQDGVIFSIDVYAGTPAVRPGDTVKAGDVLIYGYERSSNATITPLRARGKVLAKTYVSETASLSTASYETVRTGNSQAIRLLRAPLFTLPLTPEPAYLTAESESHFVPLGGAWLPVCLEKRTVYEVYLNPDEPDLTRLKAESGRLAMQKLLLSVAENDEIIDKWLDYSMIEGGIILASATAEVLSDIGRLSPETPY